MPLDILLGLQWGDEGKGKIVDLLSAQYPVIARFQGGPNAGHTIIVKGEKFVLHQIPSGIIREGIVNIIGNGVVLDPIVFKKEVDRLASAGIDAKSRLVISRKATLILPTHKMLDQVSEQQKGDNKIGSTLRGIGPAYQDKAGRNALRTAHMLAPTFEQELNDRIRRHRQLLSAFGQGDAEVPLDEWLEAVEFMRGFKFDDTEYLVNKYLSEGTPILAEGAQGTLLDADFGTYPFVTSSNTIAAGACVGLGVSPRKVGEVIGVFKAYTTRVGSGPFPTELHDEAGQQIRDYGHEYGSTTGRPRRCGWLDLPALQYAIMLNGATRLIMMKADVLDKMEEVAACTHYHNAQGQRVPYSRLDTEDIQPQYETLPGWLEDITATGSFDSLPKPFRRYIEFIEKHVGLPLDIISTGPDREQTVYRSPVGVQWA